MYHALVSFTSLRFIILYIFSNFFHLRKNTYTIPVLFGRSFGN
jgi:hypothetical protein